MIEGQEFINKNNPNQKLTIKEVQLGKYCRVEISNYVILDYLGEISSGTLTCILDVSEIESDYERV